MLVAFNKQNDYISGSGDSLKIHASEIYDTQTPYTAADWSTHNETRFDSISKRTESTQRGKKMSKKTRFFLLFDKTNDLIAYLTHQNDDGIVRSAPVRQS